MVPRGSAQQLVATAVVAALTAGLSACSAGDDAVRILGRQTARVDDVAREVPPTRLPQGRVTVGAAEVEQEIDSILTPVLPIAQEDPVTARQVTSVSCDVLDVLDVYTFDDAVTFAVQRSRTPAAYRSTVSELSGNLYAAGSSTEQAAVLAQAAVCQWAGG